VVELVTVVEVAFVPPKVALAPTWKSAPVNVTETPPDNGPLIGETLVMMGPETYVNPLVNVPVWLSGFLTTTFTAPADRAGVTAVSCVALTKVTEVAAVAPKVTVAPSWKFVPVIVTEVPPEAGPEVGETLVTVGAAK